MKLSICCITYNHEKYIEDALNSFLNQKLNFDFEIIIGDDASTDNTQKILKQYQEHYPEIIKPILRKNNIGSMENFMSVLKEAQGDYVAYCDGDDYWIDDNKIIKQIDALEKHPKCSFSFHDTLLVDQDKKPLKLLSKGRKNEYFEDGVISGGEVIGAPIRIAHANSLLFRKEVIEDLTLLEKLKFSPNGDFALTTILASYGDAYYFKKAMGTYRIIESSISNSRKISDQKIFDQLMRFYAVIDEHFKGRFQQEILANKIGMKMSYIEEHLTIAKENKKLFFFVKSAIQMLLNYKNSQYSFRDVLWIIRQKIKGQ